MPPPTESPGADAGRPPDNQSPTFAALGGLFARTSAALARTQPFDHAELVLLDDGDTVIALGFQPGQAEAPAEVRGRRADYSAGLWPSAEDLPRAITEATAELSSAAKADLALLDAGARSLLVTPLRVGERLTGMLLLMSRIPDALDPARSPLLAAVSEFLAIAAERERMWAVEQRRHARRVRLEATLPLIAESLDIRNVFPTMSPVIREVIPHDVMAFALLNAERTGVRVQAATQQGVRELPEYRFSHPEEALDANWRFLLAHDLEPLDDSSVRVRISPRGAPHEEVVTQPGPQWIQFIRVAGIRSTMRVPIRAKGRPIGGVAFMSRAPDTYDEEDGVVASRIADHVALALAHQDLAEEARHAAVAEERTRMLEHRVEMLSRELDRFSAHRAIGQSAAWRKALGDAAQVAPTDTTVLVTGESGTGKEVIARVIHRGSRRAEGPFVALNCAALPEQLLESELFGHERGAFTGAVESRAGKIEQAAGGVLFLDEVGEMTPAVQAKFLRVLQEREFQRVGGSKVLRADVRIVAATNRDPRAGIASGAFREDLYYRLSVFEIHLPPLRERPEDILLLADAFLEEVGQSVGRPAAGLADDARELLLVHRWPGNVRELKNAIERAVILAQGGRVTREHLPMTVSRPEPERVALATAPVAEFPVEGVALDSVERDLVVKAMAKAGHNKSQAARLLGLTRGQLYSLLRRHGLTDAKR
jgi:transcriptional regulator with GAF, ATPase, and Fis domain